MSPRAGRLLGAILILLAAIGGVGIFLTSGDDANRGEEPGGGDADGAAPLAPIDGADVPAPSGPIDLGDGRSLVVVGPVPGATSLSVVGEQVRASAANTGERFTVDVASGVLDGPAPLDSLSRAARSVPTPEGDERWVAENRQLHRLDDDGEIAETIDLDVPGAITAIDDAAVWITVTGVPGSHQGGTSQPQSYLQRVDRATGEVVARPLDDPATFRFALAADGVWVTVGRTLYRLDAVTLEPTAEVELPAPASALVRTDTSVAVVLDAEAPQVALFAPTDLASLGSIDLGPGAVGEAAVVAGAEPRLWVLRPDDDTVSRVDLVAASVDPLAVPAPRRIEADPAGGAWLLSAAEGGTLLRLAP